MVAPEERVRVVASDGERGSIPASKLQDALASGVFRLESEVDAANAAQAKEDEYGGTGGQFVAGVQGALRGLSAGVSDAASAGITGLTHMVTGGDEGPQLTEAARQAAAARGIAVPEQKGAFSTGYDTARQYQEDIAAANRGTAIASEIFGTALGLAAGTGPVALIDKLGAKAATRVAGEGAGATIGRAALRGAVEGAVTGALAGTSNLEAADYGDPVEAAQKLLFSSAEGAVVGGFMGSAFGVAESGIKAVARGAKRAWASQLDDAAKVASETTADEAMESVAARETPEGRPRVSDDIPEPARGKLAAFRDQMEAHETLPDDLKEATKQIRSAYDSMLRSMDRADTLGGIGQKKLANTLRVDGPAEAPELEGLIMEMRGQIESLLGRHSKQGLGPDLGKIEKVRNLLDDELALMRTDLAAGDVGAAYHRMDQAVKGTIGRFRKSAKGGVADDLFGDLYEKTRQHLEREDLYGALAARQKTVNHTLSNRISADRDARIQSTQVRSGEKAFDPFEELYLSNDSTIHSMLSRLGDGGSFGSEEAYRTHLRANVADVLNRAAAYGGNELTKEAENVARQARFIEDAMDAMALRKRDAAAWSNSMGAKSLELVGRIPVVGPAIYGTVKNLGPAARRFAAGVADADGAVARMAGTLASAGRKTASERAGRGGRFSPKQQDDLIAHAQELSTAGSPAFRELMRQGAEIEKEDPVAANEYVMANLRRAEYIASKVPAETSNAAWAPGSIMAVVEERSLRRAVDAAYRPQAAMERMARLAENKEDMEALRAVCPGIYAQLRARVDEYARSSKNVPDYAKRIALSQVTGEPLDQSMEPQAIARAQQVAIGQASAGQLGGGAGPMKRPRGRGPKLGGPDRVDSVYAGPVDRILDRR